MVGGGVNYVAAVDSLVVDVNLQISSNQAKATINKKKGGNGNGMLAMGKSANTFSKGL
jgi:hypothetical protein